MSTQNIMPALISEIETILNAAVKNDGNKAIKEIFKYPATTIEKYPAAIFYPSEFENGFETNEENMKTYGFRLFLVIAASRKNLSDIFDNIMPETVDAVLQSLDDNWSLSNINGHRVWLKVDTGAWTVSDEQGSIEVTAEINLSIKTLTSNN